jgi:hypothetical protein
MRRQISLKLAIPVGLLLAVATLACQASSGGSGGSFGAAAHDEPGGARLWQENCVRCHNLRLPDERSDAEWGTIMHHMRVRANLTSEEHRLILRFLRAAN